MRVWMWLGCLVLVSAVPALGQEWTRFHGPNGSGYLPTTTVPTRWTDQDYKFRVELPGAGHSSPVVWGERVFLTSATDSGARRLVLCLSADDGSLLWQRELGFTTHPKHLQNSFASPTPACDGERVYVALSDPDQYLLVALDHEGQEVWRQNLGPFVGQHGGGPSPIVYEDLVILGNEQDGPSSLHAFDRATGQPRWKVDRKADMVAYSTPCVLARPGRPDELIFASSAHGITSVDPRNGQVNWELPVFDKRSVSSPLVVAGLVFGSCGSGAGGNYVAAIRPPGDGQPTEAYRVSKSAPYVPSSTVNDELMFLWSDQGVVTCIEAADGKQVWQKRVGGKYSGSPVCTGEAVYGVSADGEVVVIAAKREFAELGRMPLGEECRSTPAISRGRLYVRTVSHLAAIGGDRR
ncbi:MAG: PQQ-like beta-propeller repeat protein [Pirellulales bacterium]|nr:PQQ-like beta-propeller repeat protein [Pirellulales bacterium]